MKIKLALCRTLLINPPILFLDEPTLGLDVNSTLFVIDKLKKLKKTIFLTSHNMYVAEKLCDRIAFINKGSIIKIGSQEEVKNLIQNEVEIEIEKNKNRNELKSDLNRHDFIKDVSETKNGLKIILNSRENYQKLFSLFSKYSSISKIQEIEQSLENLFISLYKRK